MGQCCRDKKIGQQKRVQWKQGPREKKRATILQMRAQLQRKTVALTCFVGPEQPLPDSGQCQWPRTADRLHCQSRRWQRQTLQMSVQSCSPQQPRKHARQKIWLFFVCQRALRAIGSMRPNGSEYIGPLNCLNLTAWSCTGWCWSSGQRQTRQQSVFDVVRGGTSRHTLTTSQSGAAIAEFGWCWCRIGRVRVNGQTGRVGRRWRGRIRGNKALFHALLLLHSSVLKPYLM